VTSFVEDQEWTTVIRRMDGEMFPQPHAKPSGMYCGRARRLRDGATVHTGWLRNPVACADELDRNIMEDRLEIKETRKPE
jgi:hypothetical protein